MHTQQSFKMLFLATLFVASGWSADAAEIELRSDAVVTGSVVRLGDIAEIRGEANPGLVAEWELLPLFPAPAIGKSRTVRPQELSQLLAFSDERLADCRVLGAAAVQIHSREEAAATTPAVSHAAYRPATVAASNVAPASHAAVSVKTNTASPIAVAGNLPISTSETVAVVALRKLDRGQKIRREDVALQQVSAEVAESGVINDLDAVVGREATQAINPDGLISAKMVQMPRLVRRGETVTIRSIAAGIRITTSGKALEDGSEGALIQVDLDETHERISARVVGVQQVEVYANGPRVASPKTPAAAPAQR